VLEDPALREELGQRSLDRAAQFSWKKMARETLQVYQCAAGLPEIAPGVPEGAR
jgi:glycosyltransferase involved in cell wall biosynthesis